MHQLDSLSRQTRYQLKKKIEALFRPLIVFTDIHKNNTNYKEKKQETQVIVKSIGSSLRSESNMFE